MSTTLRFPESRVRAALPAVIAGLHGYPPVVTWRRSSAERTP